MTVDKDEIVNDTREYLLHLKERGISDIKLEPRARVPLKMKNETPETSSTATASDTDRGDTLESIAQKIAVCQDCPLGNTRTNTVPGEGCLKPDIMFIGEGPGCDEDLQGRPFVGRSGKILDRLIARMGYTREQIFIGNIVKCRATQDYKMQKDRAPTPEEMKACIHYLTEQIAVIQPKVIVTLGNTALEGLFGFKGITKRRGIWLEFEGIPTMPTYHPSFLLRSGGDQGKRFWEVWEDMLKIFERIDRKPPTV